MSLVVPATDRPATLERCLAAVRAAEDPPEEVFVVDSPSGAGPAEARNLGAARASGEVLVFVDADVLVHADAFTRIRAAFAGGDLGGLFGSYDDSPEDPGVVSGFRNLLHHDVHQAGAGEATTFWSGLGAIRRERFEAVGGFDAIRFPETSIEDVELGLRLADAGDRLELDPGLLGTHLKRWTLRGMIATDFSRRGVPWAELLLERGSAGSALNLGLRHRLSALAALVAVLALPARRMRVALAALAALLVLNRRFYGLLAERRGPAEAAAGVGLHIIHHLSAVTAVLVALLRHLSASRR